MVNTKKKKKNLHYARKNIIHIGEKKKRSWREKYDSNIYIHISFCDYHIILSTI